MSGKVYLGDDGELLPELRDKVDDPLYAALPRLLLLNPEHQSLITGTTKKKSNQRGLKNDPILQVQMVVLFVTAIGVYSWILGGNRQASLDQQIFPTIIRWLVIVAFIVTIVWAISVINSITSRPAHRSERVQRLLRLNGTLIKGRVLDFKPEVNHTYALTFSFKTPDGRPLTKEITVAEQEIRDKNVRVGRPVAVVYVNDQGYEVL